MIGKLISHYKILDKLGEGGMGIVYQARDTELDRMVALKFLPERLTSNDAERARFLQEAKAASALNHPNVCTIYGIDEFEGRKFIEMEYVDGSTLRRKVSESPLRLNDAISFAIQIGEALQEAHSKGIVHRDIKCENIMVNSKNQIKVMDFGLAKLKGSLKLTRTSSTVGTLAYMAPEQIQGGDVDARSDIFSFGAVLFEMITGHMPFRGEHEAAMMYSILNEEPESVQKYRQEISSEIDRIIRRALEKDPADRYQHVDDMVSELRRVQKQSTRVVRPDAANPVPAQGTPQREARPSKNTPWLVAAGVLVLAAIAAFLFMGRPDRGSAGKPDVQTGRKMLVVLPFENLGTPEQEYFADGITEEITSKLSGLSGLGVIARSSAMQYKKSTKPIKQIGEELGVAYILQGTIRWETDAGTTRLRVNPQLISVADGTQMWSQPSDAVLASAFKLQTEIAGQVANALNVTLLQNEKQSLETKLTDNSEAYDSYLRGNEYAFRSTDERDQRIAEQMFQKAVELDPRFAEAYARLATVHASIYWEFYDRSNERLLKSKEAAEKSLQLKPDLPEAHGAMGWYYYHCLLDYEKATKEFKLALETQPNNFALLLGIASVYRRQGKFEESAANFDKACEMDPRSASLQDESGITYTLMRKYAEAETHFDRSMSLAPDLADSHGDEALLYLLWRGDAAKARALLSNAAARKVGEENPYIIRCSLILDAFYGQNTEALNYLEHLQAKVISSQNFYTPKEIFAGRIFGYLGDVRQERASYDAARLSLERDLQSHPDDTRIMSSLGMAYAGIGRNEDAVKMGKKAVELLPVTREALIGTNRLEDLAIIYTMVGNADEAVNTLDRLLSIPSWMSASMLRVDPVWKPLRNNPRFQKLIAEKQ